jgi:hypothetical protein
LLQLRLFDLVRHRYQLVLLHLWHLLRRCIQSHPLLLLLLYYLVRQYILFDQWHLLRLARHRYQLGLLHLLRQLRQLRLLRRLFLGDHDFQLHQSGQLVLLRR